MSLYRQTGEERRRRRRNIALGALGVLLIAIAIVVAATSGGGGEDPGKKADDAVMVARDGLEVLSVEYGQAVRGGRVVAQTEYNGSKADVQRARDALTGQQTALTARDAAAYRAAQAALADIGAGVAAKIEPAELERRITTARERLTALAAP